MARALRIEYPDAWYHVMNRGRRGKKIFGSGKDYFAFLELLQESCDIWGVRLSAYCLMSNHYHLLLQTPKANLARFMRHLNGIYTQRYNRRWKVDGQLFRGRYKSILVDADSYLLELLRYIHRNPMRAGIVENMKDYPWCSHHGYVSRLKKWEWLHKEFLLAMFSRKRRQAQKAYLDFVSLGESEEIKKIFGRKNLPSIIGDDDFVNWVKEKFYSGEINTQIPESKRLSPSIDNIKKEVCDYYNIVPEDLQRVRRGIIDNPRNAAIYLCRKISGTPLIEIGQQFNLSNYSSVSSVIIRVKEQLGKDKKLRKSLRKIEEKLTKSQTKT